ncbi:MAG: glucose-6-phosphate dehydrogenase assembly protein OpcA [Acidobacteriia bacterium]|nr:glucose-6-phosphate dehydrogenase assembly protein OpcA [Terriglobia bacterium]
MSTVAVQPERILKDLQQLWAQMAQDQAESGGVLRACAMTLVVAAEDSSDAERVRQTVGVLMHNHPSRAVILHPGGSGADLDARIFAECWKPFGKAQQICSEGIEITAGRSGFSEVAKFLVPLRVPDLPVVLWCRGAAALDPGPLESLFPLADKIIFDSGHVADADSALQFLRRLRGRGRRVADLHWTRITGWREVLAHLFDDRALKPEEVKAAQVTFGGPAVTTEARYFAAWIRTSLPGARVTLSSGDGPPGLRSVMLSTASDSLTIALGSDHCVEVSGCGRHYRSLLPSASEEALMQEELGILGPDPVYERALTA